MMSRTLVPDATEVALECLKVAGPGQLLMLLRTVRSDAACPGCGTFSARVHSRYLRRLSDLPWEGLPVRVQLRTRRFFCVRPGCSRTIFAERLPFTVARYARRTCRLSRAYSVLAMALGGEAGARLAIDLGIRTSGDSLLRHLRRNARSLATTSPRVLGIDDWAWRKGHRYGTILCDLERGAVVDLLPDRDAESVQNWLRAHPGAEVISRDRASAYAEAARKAAPKAVQVADRREIREQGFVRGARLVRLWIRNRYGPRPALDEQTLKMPVAVLRASPRSAAWWLLAEPAEARAYLEQLCQRSPEIAYCAATARSYAHGA